MNEKDLKILEQYDLQMEKIYRGRGSYLCEAVGNIYLFREYHVSEEKACAIAQIVDAVSDGTDILADKFIRNKEGYYISRDRDKIGFVLKKWCRARECDTKNIDEILTVVHHMAKLHKKSDEIGQVELNQNPKICREEFEKRIKEMKKVRNYIVKKKSKTEFELLYLKSFDKYMLVAVKALEDVSKLKERPLELCHGDFTQHNALIGENGIYIVNFEKCHYGSQMEDLYLFMRKILEKHEWDIEIRKKMLNAYIQEKPLDNNQKQELYLRFLFPEKFWKISNHYYNSRKVWGIERNKGKLNKLNEQMDIKQKFVYGL